MAAANESLLQAAADGNVAGLQQAIAAGPAPESREEEHKAAKKVAEGRQLQLHVLLQGQPPLTVLAFLPRVACSFVPFLQVQMSITPTRSVQSRPQPITNSGDCGYPRGPGDSKLHPCGAQGAEPSEVQWLPEHPV